MKELQIDWDNIDDLEDYLITYLLYQENLSYEQISRIRNKDIESVKNDLISAKMYIREISKSKEEKNSRRDLKWYMGLSKDERLKYIDSISNMSDDRIKKFKYIIYNGILKVENMEDLMVLIWTAGELRDPSFLGIIYPFVEKKHANARRIAYSAIGKIGSDKSIEIIEMGLMDDNAQVRQYCAKALGNIGNVDSVKILENILANKRSFEKEYVIRACEEALNKLKSKYNL